MSSSLLVLAAALAIHHSRVAIRFVPDGRLPSLVASTAIREAGILWSSAGVVVEPAGSNDETGAITVVVESANPGEIRNCAEGGRRRPTMCLHDVLASARFVNGKPTGVVIVFLNEVLRLIERGRLAGTAEWQWPRLVRERIIGRVLGRVIAHELGHVMLESREHARTGLMRATHRAVDLIEPGRGPFRLR